LLLKLLIASHRNSPAKSTRPIVKNNSFQGLEKFRAQEQRLTPPIGANINAHQCKINRGILAALPASCRRGEQAPTTRAFTAQPAKSIRAFTPVFAGYAVNALMLFDGLGAAPTIVTRFKQKPGAVSRPGFGTLREFQFP